jgi:hypothetical protein
LHARPSQRRSLIDANEEAVLLRTQVRALDLCSDIARAVREVLQERGLSVSDNLENYLTFASASELDAGGAHVIE